MLELEQYKIEQNCHRILYLLTKFLHIHTFKNTDKQSIYLFYPLEVINILLLSNQVGQPVQEKKNKPKTLSTSLTHHGHKIST